MLYNIIIDLSVTSPLVFEIPSLILELTLREIERCEVLYHEAHSRCKTIPTPHIEWL